MEWGKIGGPVSVFRSKFKVSRRGEGRSIDRGVQKAKKLLIRQVKWGGGGPPGEDVKKRKKSFRVRETLNKKEPVGD